MIQFLADNIDQLDLALDQLAIADRNFDRFALMLIDNVVELTFHRFAQDKVSDNDLWTKLGKPKHDTRVIQEALSHHFDSKAKLACKLGLMDRAMCESILNLHFYRNTSYHKGLRHERILHSLAVFYFRNACKLLIAYEPRWWSWSSSDKLSHRAVKYLGDARHDHRQVFNAAYTRLDKVAASMPEDLVGDLATDMSETIDHIDSALNFLSSDSPQKKSRDEVVIHSQAWPYAFTEEAQAFAKSRGCREENVGPYVEWLVRNYDWPVKTDPIPGWRQRHSKLASERDYNKALKRYCDFMHQTDSVRAHVSEFAAQLDSYTQHQIDLARGK